MTRTDIGLWFVGCLDILIYVIYLYLFVSCFETFDFYIDCLIRGCF